MSPYKGMNSSTASETLSGLTELAKPVGKRTSGCPVASSNIANKGS